MDGSLLRDAVSTDVRARDACGLLRDEMSGYVVEPIRAGPGAER
jgi:hypothetical protein